MRCIGRAGGPGRCACPLYGVRMARSGPFPWGPVSGATRTIEARYGVSTGSVYLTPCRVILYSVLRHGQRFVGVEQALVEFAQLDIRLVLESLIASHDGLSYRVDHR